MPSGPELAAARFDEPDVFALVVAQQEEMRGIYEGEADIGPTRDAECQLPQLRLRRAAPLQ